MSARSLPFSQRTAWGRNLAAPVRDFLNTETGGAALMLGATSWHWCGRTRRPLL